MFVHGENGLKICINFFRFSKVSSFGSNSKGLAFSFTDICLFMEKMSGEHMGSTGRARGANPLRCIGGRLVGRFGWVGLLRPGDGLIGLSP
jgi:hypothetical protein